MSPEIGGWNPAFVFGVAVTVAAIVGGWMWNRAKRLTTLRRTSPFPRLCRRGHHHMGPVACLALRLGEPGAAVVIAIGIAVVALIAIGL